MMKLWQQGIVMAAIPFCLAACGTTPGDRALSGGAIGAGSGAAIGAIAGGPVGAGTGALVGGGVGAATGAVTSPNQVALGKPVWR
jgi:osmotically inducible lipoprotein OsmB